MDNTTSSPDTNIDAQDAGHDSGQHPIAPAVDAPDGTVPPKVGQATGDEATGEGSEEAIKSRFTKAIDDARATAESLRNDAAELTAAARDKAGAVAAEWSEQARDKGLELARQGKDKTSEAIAVVGRALADTAPVIDERLGVQYGEYARAAASSLENSAKTLAEKDFAELGDDVKAFVRSSPATALGIAAVTGFLFARLFSRSGSRDA